MIADNVTEPPQLSSLAEALIDQVSYVYIAVEFNDTAPLNTIELGDGKYYGRYLNKPLLPKLCYRVAIRIVFNEVRSCEHIILVDCFIRNSCIINFYRTVNCILHTVS